MSENMYKFEAKARLLLSATRNDKFFSPPHPIFPSDIGLRKQWETRLNMLYECMFCN